MEPTLFIYMMDGRERLGAMAAEVTRRATRAWRDDRGWARTRSEAATRGRGRFPTSTKSSGSWCARRDSRRPTRWAPRTRNAARAVGAEAERGTVEPGKLADFVVLDADPLADIANTATERAW